MTRGAVLLAIALAAPHGAVAQVRDRAAPAAGTASIAGRVLTETQPPRPVRRAIVTVNSPERVGRTAVTDDAGRFTILNLPAGRYTVMATKRGWVPMSYGARASGRPGRSIALADGERATITIPLPRGAAITGVILDQHGQPPQGVTVRVFRYGYSTSGERRLTPASAASWGPDERGAYRIYSLAPGDYYIAAAPPIGLTSQSRDLHLTSDVDVQEAQRALLAGPGVPITDVPQRAVGLAPVFYPGTAAVAQATPVTVRAGEERAGIDFTVAYVGAGHVSGTVQGPDGPASSGARVYLLANNPSMPDMGFLGLRGASVDTQGRFDFSDVTPGQYVLAAHVAAPGPAGANASPQQVLHAIADIDAQGDDIRGLTLHLQEGFTISGVVRFDGTATPPPFTALRVSLASVQNANPVSISSGNMNVDANGRFTLTGVTPGLYRLTITPPPPWIARSSMVGGQDSLDAPVDIRQSVSDAVITLTDRASELTGTIQGAGAGEAPDYTLILFPENRAQWVAPSRRIMTASTANDGTFSFRSVPAGEYRLAAVQDVERGEWYDPAFLQRLLPSAMPVVIAEGEKKVQDIRLGGSAK